jgi:hypothetical protein
MVNLATLLQPLQCVGYHGLAKHLNKLFRYASSDAVPHATGH